MEVLANGMTAKFWIPVEEEPDIDRFIDEQIMIDMEHFMLVGTLIKVSTCKKKNEEKEYEYFKQLQVSICNICLAADNNYNIPIPGKKDEFLYPVKFRYAQEPQQEESMEQIEAAEVEIGKDEEVAGSPDDGMDELDKVSENIQLPDLAEGNDIPPDNKEDVKNVDGQEIGMDEEVAGESPPDPKPTGPPNQEIREDNVPGNLDDDGIDWGEN